MGSQADRAASMACPSINGTVLDSHQVVEEVQERYAQNMPPDIHSHCQVYSLTVLIASAADDNKRCPQLGDFSGVLFRIHTLVSF